MRDDEFGSSVALSGDGGTLAVGAWEEDSSAVGIDGDQADNAVMAMLGQCTCTRATGGVWTQQAYVKASNTGQDDHFGWSVALSGDGSTLAVGANVEDSNATGIDGNQANNAAVSRWGGVRVRSQRRNVWTQQAYVKASNTDAGRPLRGERGAVGGRQHPGRRRLY
jgi:hypothetical protein